MRNMPRNWQSLCTYVIKENRRNKQTKIQSIRRGYDVELAKVEVLRLDCGSESAPRSDCNRPVLAEDTLDTDPTLRVSPTRN